MSSVYHQALEDLAAKRRAITELIVSLARVAGIDPAPYLDRAPAVTDDAVDRVVDGLWKTATKSKDETPPNPQSPASPATNGTGRANKVEGELPAEILAALKKHGAPMQPKDLAKLLRKDWSTLSYHVKKLEAAKQVVLSGTTFDRRVALA